LAGDPDRVVTLRVRQVVSRDLPTSVEEAPSVSSIAQNQVEPALGGDVWSTKAPAGTSSTMDVGELEAASSLWFRQKQMLAFLAHLESATSLMDDEQASSVRNEIQRCRLRILTCDAVRMALARFGSAP
jgi:hypothetical protein